MVVYGFYRFPRGLVQTGNRENSIGRQFFLGAVETMDNDC